MSRVKKPMPKWMKHYDIVAYIVLGMIACYSICYLGYIGYVMHDRKMYLPYNTSRSWLELNSYSLLPPFFAIPVAPMLSWQVKSRIELSGGDFYGIVGMMLGLGAISLFDAYKTMHVYMNTTKDFQGIKEAMHLGVRGEIYTDYTYNVTIVDDKNNSKSLIYENNRDGLRIQAGHNFEFLHKRENRPLPPGVWTDPIIADKGIRFWTHSVQLDCCGSKNYTDWNEFEGDIFQDESGNSTYGPYPPSCYCNYKCSKDIHNHEDCFKACGRSTSPRNLRIIKKRPGCHNRYIAMLRSVYLNTFILMLMMGLLYIATILVFVVNFAAVRLSSALMVDDNLFLLLRSSANSSTHVTQKRSNKYLHSSKDLTRHRHNPQVGSDGKGKRSNKVAPSGAMDKKNVPEMAHVPVATPPNEKGILRVKSNQGNLDLSGNGAPQK